MSRGKGPWVLTRRDRYGLGVVTVLAGWAVTTAQASRILSGEETPLTFRTRFDADNAWAGNAARAAAFTALPLDELRGEV